MKICYIALTCWSI